VQLADGYYDINFTLVHNGLF